MNFIDMQRQVWWMMGRPYEADIQDHERQATKDALNFAYYGVLSALQPYYHRHMRTTSFSTTSGTGVYTLDDSAVKPIRFWTADSRARDIPFWEGVNINRWGLRNSGATSSYAHYITSYQPTTTATLAGTAASMTTGGSTVTKSGGGDWASTYVGKIIRLNGEVDLTISAVASATSLTVSETYVGRLTGTGVANSPASLATCKWEISPPGRCRIEIVPAPTETETIYYDHVYKPIKMMSDSDVPDLPEAFHELLPLGACMRNVLYRERSELYDRFAVQYGQLLSALVNENRECVREENQATYESADDLGSWRPNPPDLDLPRAGGKW